MSVRRILSGFSVLAGTTLVTQAIGFVALAVAARELGPGNLGAATFSLNLAFYFAIPANFGLTLLGIRDVAREPDRARFVVGEVLALRVALALVTFTLLSVSAPVVAPDGRSEELLPLAALTILADALLGEWILFGAQRSIAVAAARFAGQAVYAVLVVLFLTGGLDGARQFIYYSLLSIAITALITQAVAWRSVGRPRAPVSVASLRRRARQSLPLGLALVMVQLNVTVGALLLGYLDDAEAVGQFTVAQKIPLALMGVIQLWSATLYPQAAQLIEDQPVELRRRISLFVSLSLALALPLAAGAVLLGPDLIPVLFGDDYGPAGEAFAVIAGSLALALLTVNTGSVLAAGGQERRYAAGRSLAAAATVVSGLALISVWGLMGAAVAMVIGEAVALVFMTESYRRVVGGLGVDWDRALRAVGATALMCLLLVILGDTLGAVPRLGVAVAVWTAGAVALGVVRRDELRQLRRPAAEPG